MTQTTPYSYSTRIRTAINAEGETIDITATAAQPYFGLELECVDRPINRGEAWDFDADSDTDDWFDQSGFYGLCQEFQHGDSADTYYPFLVKEDGSLPKPGGLEIVTSAIHFRQRHQILLPLLESARRFGLRSYKYKECGLHLHINKRWVRYKGVSDQKLLAFFVLNALPLAVLGNRMSDYATFPSAAVHDPLAMGRGAINFNPDNTIELRFFKGNLSPEAVLGAVEFGYALVKFLSTKQPDLYFNTFTRWVRKQNALVRAFHDPTQGVYENLVATLDSPRMLTDYGLGGTFRMLANTLTAEDTITEPGPGYVKSILGFTASDTSDTPVTPDTTA